MQYPRGETSMVESAFNIVAGEDSDYSIESNIDVIDLEHYRKEAYNIEVFLQIHQTFQCLFRKIWHKLQFGKTVSCKGLVYERLSTQNIVFKAANFCIIFQKESVVKSVYRRVAVGAF